MKKTSINIRIICLVLIAGLAVASCKKDSSSTVTLAGAAWTAGTPTFTAMVGTKTLTQYYTDVMLLTPAQAAQYTALVNVGLAQSFTGTITFKSDNTYTSNLGGTPDSGTWSLSADAKKLTITSGTSAPEIADVTVLTSTKLTVSLTDTINEDLNSDGIEEIISINVTIPFTR
jgi:ABC-type proline/glycine betaine transport system substrate-binding protein